MTTHPPAEAMVVLRHTEEEVASLEAALAFKRSIRDEEIKKLTEQFGARSVASALGISRARVQKIATR